MKDVPENISFVRNLNVLQGTIIACIQAYYFWTILLTIQFLTVPTFCVGPTPQHTCVLRI